MQMQDAGNGNENTYKWKVHNGKIEINSFVVKFRS